MLDVQPALGIQHARNDSQDLAEADAVIVVTGEPSTSGGLHAEFGMALALKKRLILVGPRENVFHTLPQVEHYASWSQLVMALAAPYWKKKAS